MASRNDEADRHTMIDNRCWHATMSPRPSPARARVAQWRMDVKRLCLEGNEHGAAAGFRPGTGVGNK